MWRERDERAGRGRPVAEARHRRPAGKNRVAGLSSRWFLLIGAVILLDIFAFIAFPPVPEGRRGRRRRAHSRPASSRTASSSRRPRRSIDFDPANAPSADALVTFHPSISNTILTMWIVMAVVLIAVILMVRGSKLIPEPRPEHHRAVYELLRDFGLGIAGPTAAPYIPIFVGVLPARSCSTTGSG